MIAIVSPSSVVKREYVVDAAAFLAGEGFQVKVMPHAMGPADGSYAASLEHRLSDFRQALDDDEVDTIFCARGGYGAVQLLPFLDVARLAAKPKMLVGFSDITALHALWASLGIPSVHASMAKLLSEHGADPTWELTALMKMLRGDQSMDYVWEETQVMNPGRGEARIIGGNWAVFGALGGTKVDMLRAYPEEDFLLFLEDVGEPIYRIDRLLHQLVLSPSFERVKGILFGQFTNYRPDINFQTVEQMLRQRISRLGLDIPVAFNAPIGHEGPNAPIVEGARVKFDFNDKVKIESV